MRPANSLSRYHGAMRRGAAELAVTDVVVQPRWLRRLRTFARESTAPLRFGLAMAIGVAATCAAVQADPRTALWRVAQTIVASSAGWHLVATELYLTALGLVVVAARRWMFDDLQAYRDGRMSIALWLAIPVLVAAYGFGIPIVVAALVHHARPSDFPYLLSKAIASTGYAPYLMLLLAVYSVWGLAVWSVKFVNCLNIKRGIFTT